MAALDFSEWAEPDDAAASQAAPPPGDNQAEYKSSLPDFSAWADETASAEDEPANEMSAWNRGFARTLSEQDPEMLAETLEGLSYQAPEWMREGLQFNAGKLRDLAKQTGDASKLQAGSLWDISSVDEALTWLGENSGSALASSVPSLITATGVGIAGKRIGGKWGARIGVLGGAAAGSYAFNYGEVYKALKEGYGEYPELVDYSSPQAAMKPTRFDPELASGLAMYMTVPIAGLDTIVPGSVISRLGGLKEAQRTVARGFMRRVIEEAGKAAAQEGATESGQEALKQAAISLLHDKDFWTWDNLKQIIESGAAGATGGGPLGAVSGVRSDKVRGEPEPDEEVPPPTPTEQPEQGATPSQAATTVTGDQVTGTTASPGPPPASPPEVGNPKSAPKGSKRDYPAKKTKKKAAAPNAVVDVTDPAVVAALTPEQEVKPELPTATDIAANVEALAQQPQPVDRLDQDVISPLPPPEAAPAVQVAPAVAPPAPAVAPPAPAVAPPVTQEVTPPAPPPVQALDPEAAQRENEPLASDVVGGRRILPDLSVYAEPQLTNEQAVANVQAAEKEAAPKVVKGKNRTTKQQAARQANNTIATEITAQFKPSTSEKHVGSKGARGVKARAAMVQRVRSLGEEAKKRGFKYPGAFRDNTQKEMNHNPDAAILSIARVLANKKEITDEDLLRFAEDETLLRSGDEVAVAEVLRRRREEGDARYKQTVAETEAVADEAPSEASATSDIEAASIEELDAAGVDTAEADRAKDIAEARREDEQGRVGTAATAPVGSETQGGGAVKLNDGTEVDEKTGQVRAKAASGEKLDQAKKAKLIAEMNAKLAAEQKKPSVGPKGKKAVAKAKEKAAAPTEAQKEAGNYQKRHERVNGLEVSIENEKGSIRSGTDKGGKKWSVKMPADYGYIKRTKGADGDQVDVYLGPKHDEDMVYVVDQVDPDTKKFDEHKVLMGFENARQAFETYIAAFNDGKGKDRIGQIMPMTMEQFKAWLDKGSQKKPAAEARPNLAPVNPKMVGYVHRPDKRPSAEVWRAFVDLLNSNENGYPNLSWALGSDWGANGRWNGGTPEEYRLVATRLMAEIYGPSEWHQVIGVKQVPNRSNSWGVTFNGSIPGDSRTYSTREAAVAAAESLVSKDPLYRRLEVTQESKPEKPKRPKKAKPTPEELEAQARALLGEEAAAFEEAPKGWGRIEASQQFDHDLTEDVREYSRDTKDNIQAIGERFATRKAKVSDLVAELKSNLLRLRLANKTVQAVSRALGPRMVERIAAIIPDVQVYFVPPEVFLGMGGSATVPNGTWFGKDGVIFINNKLDAAYVAHTLLHEMVHAAFVKATWSNKAIRNMVRRIMDDADRKMSAVDRVATDYAFTNLDEFIAEVFSKPSLQHVLAHITASPEITTAVGVQRSRAIGRQVRNLWQAMVDVVRQALGLREVHTTLLDAMMQVGAELEFLASAGIVGPVSRSEVLARTAELNLEREVRSQGLDFIADSRGDLFMDYSKSNPLSGFLSDRTRSYADYIKDFGAARTMTTHQLRMQYGESQIGAGLSELEKAVAKITRHIDEFQEKYAPVAQAFFDYKKAKHKEADTLTTLGLDLTNLGVHLDGDTLSVPGKDTVSGWQARGMLPALQATYDSLSPAGKRVFKQMAAFYRETYNSLITESVKALLQPEIIGKELSSSELNALTQRVMDGTLTEEDRKLLGDTIYHAIEKEKSFRAIKGVYFPRLRYGDHVVTAEDPIDVGVAQAAGGDVRIEKEGDNTVTTVLFRNASKTEARRLAENYVGKKLDVMEERPARHVWVDRNTGKILTRDEAAISNDVDHGYVVYPQTKAVYFFETAKEANKFHRTNPEGHAKINRPEKRIGEDYRASVFTGTQMATLLKSVEQRFPGEENKGQRALMRGVLTQAAAMQMQGNRITSRRLKARKVKGASHDFARNVLSYGEAAARHIAHARSQPLVRRALSSIASSLKNYEGKDRPQLVAVMNEVGRRYGQADLNYQVPDPLRTLFSLTFIRLLADISYNIVNSTQNIVLGVPILGGEFGNARTALEFSRAYDDMGFGRVLKDGVINTIRATKQFRSLGLTSLENMYKHARDRLAKQKDGAELLAMLDDLESRGGALDATSGFEVAESSAFASGAFKRNLARVDRIARQMPKGVEVVNRVSAAVTAYRLARKAGFSPEKARDKAYDSVLKIHGNYDTAVQPRMFKNPWLSPLLQFKKYSHIVTYALADATYNAFKGADVKTRKAARKQLANVVAVQIALAGTLGLPGLELIKLGFLIGSALGFSDGWGDQEERLMQIAEDSLGKTWGELVTRGVITRAIGIDVSQRVGMADLWLAFGEPNFEKGSVTDQRKEFQSWLFGWVGGASWDTLADTWEAAKLAGNGDWGKAMEKFPVPKAFNNIARAINNTDGSTVDRIKNAIGFRTSQQASESRLWDARSVLTKDYIAAKNAGERVKLRAKIIAHNKIAPKNLQISLESAEKKRQEAMKGR